MVTLATIFLSGLFLEPFGSCSLTCKSLFIFLQKNFRSLCTCLYLYRHCCLCCSIFKELAALTGQLVYYITPGPSCQYLFYSFFDLFYSLCTLYTLTLLPPLPYMQMLHLNTLLNLIHSPLFFLQPLLPSTAHDTVHTYIL